MVWERVEWRQGDGRYVFEVAQGGLYGTITAPQGRALTLPIVAWEGLLDALAAARKSKQRSERNMPARTGARWSEAETAELAKTFKSGGSIGQLARIHNRTQYAIEAQLERLGLWDRAARQPMGRVATRDFQELARRDGITHHRSIPASAPLPLAAAIGAGLHPWRRVSATRAEAMGSRSICRRAAGPVRTMSRRTERRGRLRRARQVASRAQATRNRRPPTASRKSSYAGQFPCRQNGTRLVGQGRGRTP